MFENTPANLLLDVATLRQDLEDPALVVLDVRFTAGGPSRRAEYENGHIPGAIFVELGAELAGPRVAGEGALPLPSVADLQASVARWGIGQNSRVVVYGGAGEAGVTRAWFVLRWAGFESVRVLDGGLDAWLQAGESLSTDQPSVASVTAPFLVVPGSWPTLTTAEAAALPADGVLIDARKENQFQKGHIPTAHNLPSGEVLSAAGLLRDRAELAEYYRAHGITDETTVGAYCGGGVAATLHTFALSSIGIRASVYVGSWSAWTADPDRPVAVQSTN